MIEQSDTTNPQSLRGVGLNPKLPKIKETPRFISFYKIDRKPQF